MAKQLNIDLKFNANTTQAEQALSKLSASLNQISNITASPGLKLSKDLEIAKRSAQDLQQHLINAFNVKTGNLDLSKLNMSLQQSGQSLGQLSSNLLKAGQSGQQAFMNIQRSISMASVQINQANGALHQFYTTLMNTARWQIASSLLHGMVSSIQSAWSYSKELDKSLNNIRIVTGYSADYMADFAEQANKAAKALHTTTTEYTNASLIYFQQGLSEEEVVKRTEVTIKMAQAAGQSAEIVSDQLTAIWNNFYDGSESLEYYADAITALGAATASSTDEIAQGLEKFASVAETVGLSYKYATAALATVTATTRQSADVVGTAFKTLFARLNDLKLGETLDDGTTLGTYTENLAKVGVNIKTASGELKDMDTILTETAERWKTLDKDQQVALAKGVAGIRQYNQFISLMANWDFMEENLKTVENATGTLQQQADIYADSWEAANDRVRAAAEGIYRDLFPTEKMTGMMDGFATFLNGVDGLVQGLGGLKGILMLISTLVLNTFKLQLGGVIDSVIGKFSSMASFGLTLRNAFGGTVATTTKLAGNLSQIKIHAQNGAQQAQIFETSLEKSASLATKNSYEMGKSALNAKGMTDAFQKYSSNLMQVNNIQATIEQSSRYLTNEQKQQLSLLQQSALAANEEALAAQNTAESERERYELMVKRAGANLDSNYISFAGSNFTARNENVTVENGYTDVLQSGVSNGRQNIESAEKMLNIYSSISNENEEIKMALGEQGNKLGLIIGEATDVITINKDAKKTYSEIYEIQSKINNIVKSGTLSEEEKKVKIKEILNSRNKENKLTEELLKNEKLINSNGELIEQNYQDIERIMSILLKDSQLFARLTGETPGGIQQMEEGFHRSEEATNKANMAMEKYKNSINQVSTTLTNALSNAMSVGNIISSMAGGFSTVAMGISSITNAMQTLKDDSADFSTKLTAGAMAATMGMTGLMTILKGVNSFILSGNMALTKKTTLQTIETALTKMQTVETEKSGKAELAKIFVEKMGMSQEKAEIAVDTLAIKVEKEGIETTYESVAADYAKVASQAARLWYITLIIAAIAALVAITVALITAESKEAQEAEKAAKKAEQVKKAYEETKQAAEDLKSTVDKYKDAKDSMAGLKKGTLEYKEALLETNEQALQLLNTYEGLAKYTSRNNEGLIIISNEGLDEIINQQVESLERQQIELYKADLEASIKQEKLDIANFAKSQDIDEDIANSLLSQITQFFDNNPNVEDIGSIDLDIFSAYNSATEEQQISIEKNIDKYNAMAKQLMATNSAQKILTDAYLDAEYRLRHPDTDLGEDGAINTQDLLTKTLFDTYSSQELSKTQQDKYKADYKQEQWNQYYDSFIKGNSITGAGASEAYATYSAYQNRTGAAGIDDAKYYAELMGYDAEKTENVVGNFFQEVGHYLTLGAIKSTHGFQFYDKSGNKVGAPVSGYEIFDKIANKKALDYADSKSLKEAPDILASLDGFMNLLEPNLNSESLRNLMASGGKLQSAGMTQETAQYIKNNWNEIEALFQNKSKEFGFWSNLGFSNSDDYLSTLKTWVDDRSNMGDEEAIGKDRVIEMKNAVDTVGKELSSGNLTAENAEDNTNYNRLVNAAKQLAQIYPELADEAQVLANTDEIGRKAWSNAYDTILEKINLLNSASEANNTLQKLQELTGKDYHSFFNSLTSEEQLLFYKIDVDKYQSEEAIKVELARLQGIADENKIKTTLTSIETAQSLLTDDMTEEDWIELRDKTIKWGEDGIIAFNEFTNLTFEQQKKYLEDLSLKTNNLLIENTTKTIQILEELLNTVTDPEEKAAIQENINILKSNLQIYGETLGNGLSSTKTLIELQHEWNKALQDGSANLIDYIQNLIKLSEQYDNTFSERKNLKLALTEELEKPELPSREKLDYANFHYDLYSSTAQSSFEEWLQASITNPQSLDTIVKQNVFEEFNRQKTEWELIAAKEQSLYNIELEKYNKQLEEYNKQFQIFKQLKNELEVATYIGEQAQEYGLDAQEIEIQSEQIHKLYENQGLTAMGAARIAVQNQKVNQGMIELTDNWADWSKELRKSNKTTTDYAKAASSVTKTIAKLVGASEDLELPREFLESEENLVLIDKAAQGSQKAIEQLGIAVAKTQIGSLQLFSDIENKIYEMDGTEISFSMTTDEFDNAKTRVLNGITQLQEQVANGSIKVGDSISAMNATWVEDLNKMALATGMSVQEMNSLLTELGVDTEVKIAKVTMPRSVPKYQTNTTITARDQLSNMPTQYTTTTAQIGVETMQETFEVAQIGTEGSSEIPDIKYVGNINSALSPSSTSSGGGSKPKPTKKSDAVKRYKENDDKQSENQALISKNDSITETLWGNDKIARMEKNLGYLDAENDRLKERLNLTKDYVKEDYQALQTAIEAAGLKDKFTFDKDGRITNYETVMTDFYNSIKEADDSINEANQELLDNLTSAEEAYNDSLNTLLDDEQAILDNDIAKKDAYYGMLQEQLAHKQELLDSDLEYYEYYISKYQDNVYKQAELGAYYGNIGSKNAGFSNNLISQFNDLQTAYDKGEITTAKYKEGMKDLQSQFISNYQTLAENKTQMEDYYSNTLSMAQEEISKYTDKMENLNSVLDHYSSILDLVGKEQDYDSKRSILNSKANNVKRELETQTKLYQQYSEEALYWQQLMEEAQKNGDDTMYETYKKSWEAAAQAQADAQDAMLSKTEEWAEAQRAVVENELAGLGKALEEALTGGTDFDTVNTAMERASSLQEEYLTTTNKIYETNKLMRQAQQEIDKTTNTVAKNRMKQFINETQQLQNQNKLSQYELDIQQAKYDLLLAEIALEEAQNAKSTVRLQRDAEGNFGYVYTADSSKVADAEQKLADAQNALYNKGLEGANDYNQKYAETMSEMYDTLTELQTQYLEGAFDSEQEYQDAIAAAKEYYYQKLEDYSSLHAVALSTDSRVIADAWSTDFNEMVYKTEEWKSKINEYSTNASGYLTTWTETVSNILKDSGLDKVDETVSHINTESEKLITTLLGEDGESGVVGAMNEQRDAALGAASAYREIYTAIDEAMIAMDEYINKAHAAFGPDGVIKNNIDAIDTNVDEVINPKGKNDNSNENTNSSVGTWDRVLAAAQAINRGAWGTGAARISAGQNAGYTADEIYKAQQVLGYVYGGKSWDQAKTLLGFDTGGYTGDWGGSYGKLAMLHKKELVLEPGDTQNFLMSMEILDRIVSAIDLYSMNAQLGGLLNSPTYSGSNSPETLEQNVHIEASFPGITEHNELEIALTDLINQASQYANRK